MEQFLPYLDLKTGLPRVANNKKLYIKLLKIYLAGLSLDKIKELIANNDISQALIDVHTLKGTSANLSISALFDAVFALEHKMKNNESFAEELIQVENIMEKTKGVVAEVITYLENQLQ